MKHEKHAAASAMFPARTARGSRHARRRACGVSEIDARDQNEDPRELHGGSPQTVAMFAIVPPACSCVPTIPCSAQRAEAVHQQFRSAPQSKATVPSGSSLNMMLKTWRDAARVHDGHMRERLGTSHEEVSAAGVVGGAAAAGRALRREIKEDGTLSGMRCVGRRTARRDVVRRYRTRERSGTKVEEQTTGGG
jgi:hypothetical protein